MLAVTSLNLSYTYNDREETNSLVCEYDVYISVLSGYQCGEILVIKTGQERA